MGGAGAGALYDMSIFLSQPHPFARSADPAVRPLAQKPPPAVKTPTLPQAPRAVPRQAPPSAVKSQAPPSAVAVPAGRREGQIISEIRIGGLAHDQGPFSHNKEGGFDTNLEVLFVTSRSLQAIYAPRPHMGVSVNSAGHTSQVYVGLTWEWDFLGDGFFDLTLGGAYHNGETTANMPNKKDLGCSFLFRESFDLGYRISGPHSLMFHLNHTSNANLCSPNEGLESVGIRYGYRF